MGNPKLCRFLYLVSVVNACFSVYLCAQSLIFLAFGLFGNNFVVWVFVQLIRTLFTSWRQIQCNQYKSLDAWPIYFECSILRGQNRSALTKYQVYYLRNVSAFLICFTLKKRIERVSWTFSACWVNSFASCSMELRFVVVIPLLVMYFAKDGVDGWFRRRRRRRWNPPPPQQCIVSGMNLLNSFWFFHRLR